MHALSHNSNALSTSGERVLEQRLALPPWLPFVMALIGTVAACFLCNEILSKSSDWTWITDGSLTGTHAEMLLLLVPMVVMDVGALLWWVYHCGRKPIANPEPQDEEQVIPQDKTAVADKRATTTANPFAPRSTTSSTPPSASAAAAPPSIMSEQAAVKIIIQGDGPKPTSRVKVTIPLQERPAAFCEMQVTPIATFAEIRTELLMLFDRMRTYGSNLTIKYAVFDFVAKQEGVEVVRITQDKMGELLSRYKFDELLPVAPQPSSVTSPSSTLSGSSSSTTLSSAHALGPAVVLAPLQRPLFNSEKPQHTIMINSSALLSYSISEASDRKLRDLREERLKVWEEKFPNGYYFANSENGRPLSEHLFITHFSDIWLCAKAAPPIALGSTTSSTPASTLAAAALPLKATPSVSKSSASAKAAISSNSSSPSRLPKLMVKIPVATGQFHLYEMHTTITTTFFEVKNAVIGRLSFLRQRQHNPTTLPKDNVFDFLVEKDGKEVARITQDKMNELLAKYQFDGLCLVAPQPSSAAHSAGIREEVARTQSIISSTSSSSSSSAASSKLIVRIPYAGGGQAHLHIVSTTATTTFSEVRTEIIPRLNHLGSHTDISKDNVFDFLVEKGGKQVARITQDKMNEPLATYQFDELRLAVPQSFSVAKGEASRIQHGISSASSSKISSSSSSIASSLPPRHITATLPSDVTIEVTVKAKLGQKIDAQVTINITETMTFAALLESIKSRIGTEIDFSSGFVIFQLQRPNDGTGNDSPHFEIQNEKDMQEIVKKSIPFYSIQLDDWVR